jgi:dienelactone hydrolase
MRWRVVSLVAPVMVVVFAAVGGPPLSAHRRAADVLRRFSGQTATSADLGVDELEQVEPSGRHRLYLPRGAGRAPGLVLVHGIHRLGVDEPRLVRFARALAESGVAVLTPEVRELSDYAVDARSVNAIGSAARSLHEKLGHKVGIMGMSFAGGLSLLAACDRRYEAAIGMVVAVGAHDDAGRVARFFTTSQIERPDGTTASLAAHGYGVLVFVYAHADRFFPADDLMGARQALSSWLAEERDRARAVAAASSPRSRELLERLFDQKLGEVTQPFLRAVEGDRAALQAVSPHRRLDRLQVPVFLLHGAGDTVIPPSETQWLARQVPPAQLREVLISRALVHVEPGGQPTWYEQWELLHFVAAVLAELGRVSR